MSLRFRQLMVLLAASLWLNAAAAQTAAAQELNWAEKMFDKLKHDFGVVARGAEVRYRFKVKNLYKQEVHISDVSTTCGCSAAKPTKGTLASLEEAYIEVRMDTLRFIRRKDSNLIITFDAPLYEQVKIPITAYIRTDVVLTPGKVDFGSVDQGQEQTKKISIAYAGRDDWKIKNVETKNKHVTTKLVETGREGGRVNYELFVTLKPTAAAGPHREQLLLVTDDQQSPKVPVLVEGKVEADITVTPAVVSLGMLTPGKSKTVNLVVKGKKPFKIEKIECESEIESFKVRLPKSAKLVHVLPLTYTPPQKPGTFTEEFTVTISDRPQPVTFKAYGQIATP